MAKVSIIIPTRKINDYLRKRTIPAILKQTYQDFEIIILPDRPSKEKFPRTKIIPTWPKKGPADKRDLGAKRSKGEILAFLDGDAYPDKNWLKNAISYFKNPQIAAVCGPGVTPKDDNLKEKVSGWVWQSWLGAGGAGTYRCRQEKKREVDDYPTFNLIVRKKDLERIGGFKTHFWPGEDSMPPDEEVLIVDRSKNIRRVKIGNLVDDHLKNSAVHKDGASEVSYENPANLAVFSFDSDYKIKIKPIKAFIRHKKFHKVCELQLSRGNTIKLTSSHSLFTLNNKDGRIIPVRIRKLRPGNLVVTPRRINVLKDIREINTVHLLLSLENKFIYSGRLSLLYLRSKEYIVYLSKHYKEKILEAINKFDLKSNLPNWKYYGGIPLIILKNLPLKSYDSQLLKKFKVKIRARGHRNVVAMKSTVSVDEDLLWFLGFMSAEGWISNPDKIKSGNKWNVNLSQKAKNRAVLDRAQKILQSHLGLSFRLYKDKRYNVLNIAVNCRVLWCFLKALGLGGYSYQKKVSPFIFSLPKKKIRAFLDGYHAGDPCDYTDGRFGKFGITTASPEMAKDFVLLFLRLGEPFRITRHKEDRKLHYHDQFNIHTFCPSVKRLGMNTYLRMSKSLQDGIPAMGYLLRTARKYHLMSKLIGKGVRPQYLNKRDNRKKVTWYHIKKFLKVTNQAVGDAPEVKSLEKILNSDLRFEEILEIKEVRNQPRYTYDLSVGGEPEIDNFIAGAFVCVHNTNLCHNLVHNLGKKIVYDPKILVYHHRREIFLPHLAQISRFAIHRGHFARILPQTSLRIGYVLPTIFVLGLFGGPILIFILEIFQLCSVSIPLFLLYLFSIFIYLLLLLATAFQVYLKEKNLKLALLVIPSILITHLVYGILFVRGFLTPRLKR